MQRKQIIAAFVCMITSLPIIAEQKIFIDRGACPGEWCSYCGLYVSNADIDVYKSPSFDAEVVGKVRSGEAFITKTGEVHTSPGRFNIFQEHEIFKPGDEVYVLTYMGEGYFRVRHNGVLTEAELGFSAWGPDDGVCDWSDGCWGGLEKPLNFTWWLNIVSHGEIQGWIINTSSIREIGVP